MYDIILIYYCVILWLYLLFLFEWLLLLVILSVPYIIIDYYYYPLLLFQYCIYDFCDSIPYPCICCYVGTVMRWYCWYCTIFVRTDTGIVVVIVLRCSGIAYTMPLIRFSVIIRWPMVLIPLVNYAICCCSYLLPITVLLMRIVDAVDYSLLLMNDGTLQRYILWLLMTMWRCIVMCLLWYVVHCDGVVLMTCWWMMVCDAGYCYPVMVVTGMRYTMSSVLLPVVVTIEFWCPDYCPASVLIGTDGVYGVVLSLTLFRCGDCSTVCSTVTVRSLFLWSPF